MPLAGSPAGVLREPGAVATAFAPCSLSAPAGAAADAAADGSPPMPIGCVGIEPGAPVLPPTPGPLVTDGRAGGAGGGADAVVAAGGLGLTMVPGAVTSGAAATGGV